MGSGVSNPRQPVCRPDLAELDRFDRPDLRRPFGSDPKGLKFWDGLSGRYFGGFPDRPTGDELEAACRSGSPDWLQRSYLYNLFGCMQLWDYRMLVHRAGLSVYELVRAMRSVRAKPTVPVRWLNQFGDPE